MGGTSPGASERSTTESKKKVVTCASSLVAPVDGFLEHQVGRETKVVACCRVWCSFLALTGFFSLFQEKYSLIRFEVQISGLKTKNHTAFLDSCWRSELD